MDSSNKNNVVSKKTAAAIIIGILCFIFVYFGLGTFLLLSRLQQDETYTEVVLTKDYVYAPQEEPEELSLYEPYKTAYEYEADYEYEPPEEYSEEEELDIHPLVGRWRLVSTTDHINADMMEHGFVFYWHAYEDGTAKSRMYSPHSGWHTKEEYTWSIPYEGQLEEVLTYVSIEAATLYLGEEFAAMIDGIIGMILTSSYDITDDVFTQTMPGLRLVFHRVNDKRKEGI